MQQRYNVPSTAADPRHTSASHCSETFSLVPTKPRWDGPALRCPPSAAGPVLSLAPSPAHYSPSRASLVAGFSICSQSPSYTARAPRPCSSDAANAIACRAYFCCCNRPCRRRLECACAHAAPRVARLCAHVSPLSLACALPCVAASPPSLHPLARRVWA